MIIFYIYAFIIGSCVMSFVNVIVCREVLGMSFIKGRSQCLYCEHTLYWYDVIPILSYLILKGRCRYCHEIISLSDYIYEWIGGFIGVICFNMYGSSLFGLVVFCFIFLFIIMSRIDYEILIIPDWCQICLFLVGIGYMHCVYVFFIERIIGMFILFIPLYMLNKLYKECIGGGDLKILLIMGFVLGYRYIIIAMGIAVLCASLYACYLMVFKGVKRSAYIPFGPFLALGMIIVICFGNIIINYYTWY